MEAAAIAFKFVVQAGTKLLMKAGLSKGAALATTKFAVKTVLLSSASAALNAVMAPRVDAAGSPTDWRADETAPLAVLVGKRGVAGRIVHQDAYGPDNRFKSFVTVVSAAGPIKDFGTFKADRTAMNFGANGEATNGGQFKGNMWMQTAPGDQPQAAALAQTGLPGGGSLPGWGPASKISGKAHYLWTLYQDSKFKTYPAGEPVPLWDGAEGVFGWDPRLDSTWPGGSGPCRLDDPSTHVWINDGGLAALNYALGLKENGQTVMGMGLSLAAVDVDAHVALANICDANGWTVSAYPTTDDSKAEVYRAFLQAAGAIYATQGGRLSPIPRTPKVSVATISAADTAGPLELDTSAPLLERYNTIIPECVQADQDWQVVPLEPVTEASYVTADGRERRRGIRYSYVPDADQAAQLAAYDMVDSREGLRGRIALKPYMRKLKPGDVFTITEAGFALDGVKCLVVERETDPETSVTRVTFRSESDGKHAYALGLSGVAPQTPTVSAFDPFDVPAPGASVWSAAADPGPSPAIVITGALDSDREANAVRVEVRPLEDENGDPVSYAGLDDGWTRIGDYDADVTRIVVTGLRPATPYQVAISYVSPFNVSGARLDPPLEVTTGALNADQVDGRPGSDVTSQIDITREEVDRTRDRMNEARGVLTSSLADASQTLDQAAAWLAQDVQLGAQGARANWLQDPLFKTGVSGWRVLGGLGLPAAGAPRGLRASWTFPASGASTDRVIVWPERRPVQPGRAVQAACEVTCLGAASEALLEAVWYDADGVEIGAGLIERKRAGRLSGVATAPDGAAQAGARLKPLAARSGDGSIILREPLIAHIAPGQPGADLFTAPLSDLAARLAELTRTTGEIAKRERSLKVETRRSRAEAREIFLLQADEGGSLAGYDLTLNADFNGLQDTVGDKADAADVFFKAEANQRFLLQADNGGSLAGYDLTLNADFTGLQDTVDDKANAADVFSKSEANQRFLLQADEGGSLAGYDLTLNAQFTTTQREAIQAAEAAVVGQVEAAQRFLLQADEGGSLAGYDLTLNADFTGLQDTVGDKANAADVFSKAEANQRFLLQADNGGSLAGYDLTLNADFNGVSTNVGLLMSAYTDANGDVLSVFALEQDVSGKISGIYGFNNGQSSALDFAFDAVRFGGVQIFGARNGGTLVAQNIEVDGALIGDLSVDTIKIKDNAVSQTGDAASTASYGAPAVALTSNGGSAFVTCSFFFQSIPTASQTHRIERRIGSGSWATIRSITGNPGNSLSLTSVDQPGSNGQTVWYRARSDTPTFLKETALIQIVK